MRAAIKSGIESLGVPEMQVYRALPNMLHVPSAGCACVVILQEADYGETFGDDRSLIRCELHLFVQLTPGFEYAQDMLDSYLSNTGGRSVLQAIRNDPYLGQQVKYALPPSGFQEYGVKALGREGAEVEFLGAVVPLEVHVQ